MTDDKKNLFEKLRRIKEKDYQTFKKTSYSKLFSQTTDKYPESAHFIYELLQNADDQEATKVSFILNQNKLYFKHNSKKHFDLYETSTTDDHIDGDIYRITGLAYSSKSDNSDKIGKFGIGFKSVFQYTNSPYIYGDIYNFRIENFIIPVLVTNDCEFRQKGETLFVLPFKNDKCYGEIENRLKTLIRPLLFLNYLQEISIEIPSINEKFFYSKQVIEEMHHDDITIQKIKLIQPQIEDETLFLLSKSIPIGEAEEKHQICVGFLYDSSTKKLKPSKGKNIYCFFPTEETFDAGFICHAPFITTDNRQSIIRKEECNVMLIHELCKLATCALPIFASFKQTTGENLIDKNIFQLFPKKEKDYFTYATENSAYFQIPLIKEFNKAIKHSPIILAQDGNYYHLQSLVKATNKDFLNLLNTHQLNLLLKPESKKLDGFIDWDLSEEVQKFNFLTTINSSTDTNYIFTFDLTKLDIQTFAKKLTMEFMNEQSEEWYFKFISWLKDNCKNPGSWKSANKRKQEYSWFSLSPIIKCSNGNWCAPYNDTDNTPNVFLPFNSHQSENYNFVASELLQNVTFQDFIQSIGITKPDKLAYLEKYLLPRYQNSIDFSNDDSDAIKIFIDNFDSLKEEQKEGVAKKIKLYGNDSIFHSPNELYIKSDGLYEYFGDSVPYLNIQAYGFDPNSISWEHTKKVLTFLGVSELPKIERVPNEIKKESIYPIEFCFPSNIPYYYSNYIPKGKDCHKMEILDYKLDKLNIILSRDNISKELSCFIWDSIIPKYSDSKVQTLKFWYKGARNCSEKKEINSSFRDDLINNKWVFNTSNELCAPKDLFSDDIASYYDKTKAVLDFLSIKEKESTILDLGGTTEQQQTYNIGKIFDGYSVEEVLRLRDLFEKDKNKQSKLNISDTKKNSHTTTLAKDFTPHSFDHQATTDDFFGKNLCNFDKGNTDITNEPNNSEDEPTGTIEITESVDDLDVKLTKFREKRKQELEEDIKKETARLSIDKFNKYSYRWFVEKLKYESWESSKEQNHDDKYAIRLIFQKFHPDNNSKRIFIFEDTTRDIPNWIEELDTIPIEFYFDHSETVHIDFEAASVTGDKLRVKATPTDVERISDFDIDSFTKATIKLNNPLNIEKKFFQAFKSFNYEDNFDMQENLNGNIRFIFGPPGTGKTTKISKSEILPLMEGEEPCKILVLTPTNKACDVLTRRILTDCGNEIPEWLGRFVITSDEDIDNASLVCDRNSKLPEEDHCCIISTVARLPYDYFETNNGHCYLRDINWDLIIIDEASMIKLPQIIYTLYLFKGKNIIIAGDPMQIQPVDAHNFWNNENIYSFVGLSNFSSNIAKPFKIDRLMTQYRSTPIIGGVYSDYCYGSLLTHHRNESDQLQLGLKGFLEKPLNIIAFKVDNYDNVFKSSKIGESPIHVYSAIFVSEVCKYITNKIYTNNAEKQLKIGIICPYYSQTQIIDKILNQYNLPSKNISIIVGTTHSFQGEQCDIIFAVFNPPIGLKNLGKNNSSHINNRNIINVAISRATDYLCMFIPYKDTPGFENLVELKQLGKLIGQNYASHVAMYTPGQLEHFIFGDETYLENNIFQTAHQLANVYSHVEHKYEVRLDDSAIDIQINYEKS